jgi:hypothetical protein
MNIFNIIIGLAIVGSLITSVTLIVKGIYYLIKGMNKEFRIDFITAGFSILFLLALLFHL